jgi:hypothetical protein
MIFFFFVSFYKYYLFFNEIVNLAVMASREQVNANDLLNDVVTMKKND